MLVFNTIDSLLKVIIRPLWLVEIQLMSEVICLHSFANVQLPCLSSRYQSFQPFLFVFVIAPEAEDSEPNFPSISSTYKSPPTTVPVYVFPKYVNRTTVQSGGSLTLCLIKSFQFEDAGLIPAWRSGPFQIWHAHLNRERPLSEIDASSHSSKLLSSRLRARLEWDLTAGIFTE